MNKKYVYEFVNETVEIEISEEWETILKEEDRMEYNTDHRETRRHESLVTNKEGSVWLTDDAFGPGEITADEEAREVIMKKAVQILTPKQLDAFVKVCLEGYSIVSYSKQAGCHKSVISRRIKAAKEKLSVALTDKA